MLELLKDLPTLLREATNAERRLVLREFVTEVYGRGDEVIALRPTRLADGLFQAAAGRSEWLKMCGSGPGGRLTRATTRCLPSCFLGAWLRNAAAQWPAQRITGSSSPLLCRAS